MNCKSFAVFSTTCGYIIGMSTKNQPTSDGLRICSSFALMMISARAEVTEVTEVQQLRNADCFFLSQPCFLQQFWNRSFGPGQLLATYFYTHLGLQGPQDVNFKWFIMILESSHRVHSCILKARSQEAHHMTHWTVGIWGRYASVANDGSNLPYSHLLGYAPAGNA